MNAATRSGIPRPVARTHAHPAPQGHGQASEQRLSEISSRAQAHGTSPLSPTSVRIDNAQRLLREHLVHIASVGQAIGIIQIPFWISVVRAALGELTTLRQQRASRTVSRDEVAIALANVITSMQVDWDVLRGQGEGNAPGCLPLLWPREEPPAARTSHSGAVRRGSQDFYADVETGRAARNMLSARQRRASLSESSVRSTRERPIGRTLLQTRPSTLLQQVDVPGQMTQSSTLHTPCPLERACLQYMTDNPEEVPTSPEMRESMELLHANALRANPLNLRNLATFSPGDLPPTSPTIIRDFAYMPSTTAPTPARNVGYHGGRRGAAVFRSPQAQAFRELALEAARRERRRIASDPAPRPDTTALDHPPRTPVRQALRDSSREQASSTIDIVRETSAFVWNVSRRSQAVQTRPHVRLQRFTLDTEDLTHVRYFMHWDGHITQITSFTWRPAGMPWRAPFVGVNLLAAGPVLGIQRLDVIVAAEIEVALLSEYISEREAEGLWRAWQGSGEESMRFEMHEGSPTGGRATGHGLGCQCAGSTPMLGR